MLIENIFQIFVFFIIGYIARKLNIIPQSYSQAYINFIMNIGFPALVIYNIYNLKFGFDVVGIVILGWISIFLTIGISFIVSKMLKLNKETTSTFILMATFANTGFLGYPFVHSFYGDEGLRYGVIFDNISMFLPIFLLSPFIISYAKEGAVKLNLKDLILFPPFIALVVAILLKPFNVSDIFLNILNRLGMTVIPLVLFAVGLNLRFSNIKNKLKLTVLILFIKHFISPAILLTILILLNFHISLPYKVSILQLAMPPMVLASIYVIQADLDKDLAISSVALGIIFSFITVPLWFFVLSKFS